MDTRMKIAAIIVAAGKGIRAGGDIPKQYRKIGGEMVLTHTLRAFLDHVDLVQVVIGEDHEPFFAQAVDGMDVSDPVQGGATRQDSVKAGLDALVSHAPDIVLIHDAARPFVNANIISDVISALKQNDGALPAMPVTDTIKTIEGRFITSTPVRDSLRAAQTPQGFHFKTIFEAHERALTSGRNDFTDDSSIAEWAGMRVALTQGDARNIKITTEQDLIEANRQMSKDTSALTDIRTGNGYDVHAFEQGDAVILCGVSVPHGKKLKGHSDADVGMHALTDAIYGALCDGDIGKHFPPSDPQWKGAASDIFLKHAVDQIRARGGVLSHCDVTLVCEEPKIGPHVDAMRDSLAKIMDVAPNRISVKATTSERLGFTGRQEGIASLATATLKLPEE
ncbi:MAG: bifunctional 2-C-methyl-D-erythritol 4-phosphate cytidylyltransferase/2-C-methyl-D-erythritol 2,4-cyclodiphosphate synthase [Hyphomicrobiales bacterium]